MKKQKTLIENETLLPFWLLGTAVCSAIIHNAVYAFWQAEEAIFFTLTLLLIVAFIASVVYDIILYLLKGRPTDIWKLGWLGVFGILSIFSPGLLIFYGFFAFFGLKK